MNSQIRAPINKPNNGNKRHERAPVNKPNNGNKRNERAPINKPNNGNERAPINKPNNGNKRAPVNKPKDGKRHGHKTHNHQHFNYKHHHHDYRHNHYSGYGGDILDYGLFYESDVPLGDKIYIKNQKQVPVPILVSGTPGVSDAPNTPAALSLSGLPVKPTQTANITLHPKHTMSKSPNHNNNFISNYWLIIFLFIVIILLLKQ